jgi:hypothetical protein
MVGICTEFVETEVIDLLAFGHWSAHAFPNEQMNDPLLSIDTDLSVSSADCSGPCPASIRLSYKPA